MMISQTRPKDFDHLLFCLPIDLIDLIDHSSIHVAFMWPAIRVLWRLAWIIQLEKKEPKQELFHHQQQRPVLIDIDLHHHFHMTFALFNKVGGVRDGDDQLLANRLHPNRWINDEKNVVDQETRLFEHLSIAPQLFGWCVQHWLALAAFDDAISHPKSGRLLCQHEWLPIINIRQPRKRERESRVIRGR